MSNIILVEKLSYSDTGVASHSSTTEFISTGTIDNRRKRLRWRQVRGEPE
ncbi:MAG: hypothetical protein O3A29_11715 [Planctomycetota bacterium]|jgi:hypothetical protein|nr:hypothetical protein [Planctomycetota bacterium]